MELEEIKSKNLPVVETYEEFGEKLNEIDFSQEDFAALVTDLTSVLYADSLETIWGFIGFQWDEYNNYGHFNARSFEVGYIPQIPDAERIQKLPGNFISQMNDKEITIGYNNFSNLVEIDYILQDTNKDLNIYVDGINCKINLGRFYDTMNPIHYYQKIHFIGTQLKPFNILGNIPDVFTEQTPIYIIIDEYTKFKFPIFGTQDYGTRCAYFWKGQGDFNFQNCFYDITSANYQNIFISENNSFIISPISINWQLILHVKPNEDYLLSDVVNKIDSWNNAINLTIDWQTLERFNNSQLYLSIMPQIRIKKIEFKNDDKLNKQNPIAINDFGYICFLDLYGNRQEFVNFPWQKIIDLYDNGFITSRYDPYSLITRYSKTVNVNDTSEQVTITIHSDFIIWGVNLYTSTLRLDKFQYIYYPFIINNPDNKNIRIASGISGRDENFNSQSVLNVSYNYNINANFLQLSAIHIVYDDDFTFTFSKCMIGSNSSIFTFINVDKNDYKFICNLSNEDIDCNINVQYLCANRALSDYYLEYEQRYDYIKILKIEDKSWQQTTKNTLILGPFTNNTSGMSITGYKNIKLKNNDGAYFITKREQSRLSCKYVKLDIENWKAFYNSDIQFLCIQSNINDWYNSIIDEETTGQPTLNILHENYIQLTSEQINKLIELGYTVIDYII